MKKIQLNSKMQILTNNRFHIYSILYLYRYNYELNANLYSKINQLKMWYIESFILNIFLYESFISSFWF